MLLFECKVTRQLRFINHILNYSSSYNHLDQETE